MTPPGQGLPTRAPIETEPIGHLGTAGNEALLRAALDAAGVQLGAYDQRILRWLAGWDRGPVAVVASWVARATHAEPPGDDPAPVARLGMTATAAQAATAPGAAHDPAAPRERPVRPTSTAAGTAAVPTEHRRPHVPGGQQHASGQDRRTAAVRLAAAPLARPLPATTWRRR